MGRTIAKCIQCRQEREIVSFGLCAMCLMASRRAAEPLSAQRECNRMRARFSRILELLDDADTTHVVLSAEDCSLVKNIIIRTLELIGRRQSKQLES